MIINYVNFLIICGLTLTAAQSDETDQSEGEKCTVKGTNSDGICKLINKCPSVMSDIVRNKGKGNDTICGFSGRIIVVCCPINLNDNEGLIPTTANFSGTGRLHEEKCKEYKSAVYDDTGKNDKCGHKQIPLTVGVTLANPREFPHMALIGFDAGNNKINWLCSGTLISDRYVITVAHCLRSRKFGQPKFVRLGDLIIDSDTDEAQPEDFNIEKIIPHPEWKRPSKYNDIALLKLDRNVTLNQYKIPACLPVQFDVPEKLYIASGWVAEKWLGSDTRHLQKYILDKVSFSDCNKVHSSEPNPTLLDGIRDNTQICAISKPDNNDTYHGDSGGPLQVYHHSEYCMYTIIGISSFGMNCGDIGIPGVYTRVFPFVDWIENTIWKS